MKGHDIVGTRDLWMIQVALTCLCLVCPGKHMTYEEPISQSSRCLFLLLTIVERALQDSRHLQLPRAAFCARAAVAAAGLKHECLVAGQEEDGRHLEPILQVKSSKHTENTHLGWVQASKYF